MENLSLKSLEICVDGVPILRRSAFMFDSYTQSDLIPFFKEMVNMLVSPTLEDKEIFNMNKLKLVRFNFDDISVEHHCLYPFSKAQIFVILGEVEQMPGHCIIADIKTGQIYSCYHTEDFVELNEEEV
jgi:hypothetical protein